MSLIHQKNEKKKINTFLPAVDLSPHTMSVPFPWQYITEKGVDSFNTSNYFYPTMPTKQGVEVWQLISMELKFCPLLDSRPTSSQNTIHNQKHMSTLEHNLEFSSDLEAKYRAKN